MDTLVEMLWSRGEHLLGRTAGPLNFRLFIMPLVVTFFAVRAAMKDARAGQPPFFRTLLLKPVERPRLVRSGLKDVGKIFIVAVVLDTTYQLLVLKAFYLGELLVVVMASRHPAVSRGPECGFHPHAPHLQNARRSQPTNRQPTLRKNRKSALPRHPIRVADDRMGF